MGVRNLAVVLTGDATSLGGALRQGSAQVSRFADDVEHHNKRMISSWKLAGLGVAAAGVAVAVGLTAAGVAAAGFESRMRNVNSITGLSEAALKSQGAAVLDLSRRLPQSANILAEGLYEIASSGFQGAAGLQVLQASAEAASAGLTTTANSATAITAVLNAYGLSASSADDVSDSLFQTVNLGVVSFEALTGVIGDVVGTAAAAAVDINQVGAAVATMTLSGISAAEAGTSLNRVLQSLLQPSDALAAVYEQLGIESGEQALKADGLRGVMEKLRIATGGNVTTLLQLFPEIRAARGALSLMSQEGATYARVSGQIENADRRQGATKRALAEQMKATSAQLRLLVNGATAQAIAVGMVVLPVFTDFLHIVADLASDSMPLLRAGLDAVTPLFHSLVNVGADLVTIQQTLAEAGAPIAGVLLAIVGGSIIGGLSLLADALEGITGFLADNKTAVLALASVVGGIYLLSMIRAAVATVAFNIAVVRGIAGMAGWSITAGTMGAAATFAAAGIRGLALALLSLSSIATAGLAIAIFAGVRGLQQLKESEEKAKVATDAIRDSFDALDRTKSKKTIADVTKEVNKGVLAAKQYEGAWGQAKAGLDEAFGSGKAGDLAYKFQQDVELLNDLTAAADNAKRNLGLFANETGLSEAALISLARQNDIDLSKPWAESTEEIAKMRGAIADLERQTGVSAAGMEADVGMNIEAMEAFGKAIEDAQQKASASFMGATDVVALFDPTAGLDAQKAATERVTNATQALADLKAQQADKDKLTVTDRQALAKAQADLAEAEVAASEAATVRKNATLEGFYKNALAKAEAFATQIGEVTARGLDPDVITRLIQAGPEKAAPMLEALVADHSGRLIELVNTSEAALRDLNVRVVTMARLTAIAVNSATDENVRDLSKAMKIAQAVLEGQGKATAEAIAQALTVPTEEVLDIARRFGITLGGEIAAGASEAANLTMSPRERYAYAKAKQAAGFAGGGLIEGPYVGPRADNVVIRATPREYVQPVSAVDYYGVDFMDRLRRRQIPRFADGGMVGANGWSTTTSSGSVSVVRVPLQETRTNSRPVYVDKVVAHDYDDFREQMDAEADLSSSPGFLGAGR